LENEAVGIWTGLNWLRMMYIVFCIGGAES
jgi:hypothetical protein